MTTLDREQIEGFRTGIKALVWKATGSQVEGSNQRAHDNFVVSAVDDICDLALSAESLSRRVAELEADIVATRQIAETEEQIGDEWAALCKVQHEALQKALEKIEKYHAHLKGEYIGGVQNQILLPEIRAALAAYEALQRKEGQ